MSQEKTPFREGEPGQKIEWNGSTAEIYGIDGPDKVWIYDRADFQSPIERVRISSEDTVLDDEGEIGHVLQAEIQLTSEGFQDASSMMFGRTRPVQKFMTDALGSSVFVPYNGKDQDLQISRTSFGGVYLVSHAKGHRALVWTDAANNKVIVSNNLDLHSTSQNDGRTVSVRPRAIGSFEETDDLEGFFKIFMRTMDFASGTLEYSPQSARLKRTYPIGRETKPYVSPKVSGGVGRSAMHGASRQPSKTPEKSDSAADPEAMDLNVIDSKITLDDIGGLAQVKSVLKDIAVSFEHADIMEKWGASRPQGVLFYGPAGTGKTMLTEALATELNAELWQIQSTDIYEKWLGNSEERIKSIFTRARQSTGRLVLFFDEIDSIVGITEGPSAGGADNARNAVAGIFKQEMNTLAKENPNVLVVAATNELERIDPALIRSGRFDHRVYVPMPDEAARADIIAGKITKLVGAETPPEISIVSADINVPELAVLADTLSGADINEIFRRLSMQKAMQEARTGQAPEPITHADLAREIRNFRTGQ